MTDYKRCTFKTFNTRHVEMNTTAKRQMYKSPKRITSAKIKDLLMKCKKGLVLKHTFFILPTMTTAGGKKDDTVSNSDSVSEEDESSDKD